MQAAVKASIVTLQKQIHPGGMKCAHGRSLPAQRRRNAVVRAGLAADPLKAEVIHWWTSGGESAAVKVFADAYDKAGGQWIDSAIAGGEQARTAGINRIVGGNPPTMMQFNTLSAQLDELVKNDLLPISTPKPRRASGRTFRRRRSSPPRCAMGISTRCRSTFTARTGQHNKKVFADAGLEEPKSRATSSPPAPS